VIRKECMKWCQKKNGVVNEHADGGVKQERKECKIKRNLEGGVIDRLREELRKMMWWFGGRYKK